MANESERPGPSPEAQKEENIIRMARTYMDQVGCSMQEATQHIRNLYKESEQNKRNQGDT